MKTLLLIFFILFHITGIAQQLPRHLKAANGEDIGFLEERPKNYGNQKHPVIIFLHGSSERGNGKSELYKVASQGIPGITKNKSLSVAGSSFIVLSPQLYSKYGDWQLFYVDEMLRYARTLSIDTNRIYLTGISLGGGGVLAYASESTVNASKFAAIAPVCAVCFYDYKKLENIARASTPVWAFVGEADKVVKPLCTIQAVDGINTAKSSTPAKITVYKRLGHNAWDRAYDPTHKYQSPNLYEWLLQHKRK